MYRASTNSSSASQARLTQRTAESLIREGWALRFVPSTLDPVRPIGSQQGMKVLQELNDFEAGHDEFVKSLAPRVNTL